MRFLLLVLMVLPLLCSAEERKLNRGITIGVLTDLTGVGAYWGKPVVAGATLAIEDARARGDNISGVFEDSGLDTVKGLSGAQKLIFVDKVGGIYVDFTSVAVAVSTLVKTNRKLMIYSAAAESVVKSNPYAFKSYSDYRRGCEDLARSFKARGVSTIGILKAETEYGELCNDGLRSVYPDALERGYQRGSNVTSQLTWMKSRGVEAVLNAAYPADILTMAQAGGAMRYWPKIGTTEENFGPDLIARLGGNSAGSLTFGLMQPSPELRERAEKVTKEPISASGAVGLVLAYVHVGQMIDALSNCPESDVDCSVKHLERSAPNPALGFQGWRDRVAQLTTVIKECNGRELVDFK